MVGKQFHVGQHLRVQLVAADAADGRILVVHGDVEQVVQLTENAELSKLGYSREKDELKVRVEHLDRAVEVLHRAAQRAEVVILVNHVKQWSVIFVNDEYNLLSHLLACLHNQIFQANVRILLFALITEHTFHIVEHIGKITFKHILIHVLCATHVEVKHRVFHPVLLIISHDKSLKQVLAAIIIRMDHRGEQRLAEPTRTAQEHIFITFVDKINKILGLIYIKIFTLSNLAERLYAYRISSCLRHSFYRFTY